MAELFANNTISSSYKGALLEKHAKDERWGGSAKYASSNNILIDVLRRPYVQTLLDFGAGKQGFKKMLKKHCPHVEYFAYDPGIPEISELPDRQFDMVVSNDVMEHIEPDKVEAVIKAMWERTKYALINNIACSLAGSEFEGGAYDGQNLHLIVEDTDWWVALHEKAIKDPKMSIMSITKHFRRNSTGFKERCSLIIERGG